MQPQIAEIVQKISKIPFDDIGRDLRTTLRARARDRAASRRRRRRRWPKCRRRCSGAQASLDSLDRNVTDPNAPVQRNLEETLQELQRTSRALRVLSDYLQQHPEVAAARQARRPQVPSR